MSGNAMPKRTRTNGSRPAGRPVAPLASKARSGVGGRRPWGGRPAAGSAEQPRGRPPLLRRIGLRRIAFGVMVVAALVVAGFGIERSGLLDIRRVEVVGTDALNPRVLADRSGLQGQYVLTADLAAAERRLEQMPLVAEVEIERVWPTGVRIHVTERQGWAVWERAGRRYTVDADGHVLPGVEAPAGSPTVIDVRGGEAGDTGILAPSSIVHAVHQLRSRIPVVVGLKPEWFRYEDERGLLAGVSGGRVAIFGDGGDLEYRLAVWKALLQAPADGLLPVDWVQVVDLRFGDRPSLVNAIAPPTPTPTPDHKGGDGGGAVPKPAAAPAEESSGVRLEALPRVTPPAGLAAGDARAGRTND